jgi:hypothetical protein
MGRHKDGKVQPHKLHLLVSNYLVCNLPFLFQLSFLRRTSSFLFFFLFQFIVLNFHVHYYSNRISILQANWNTGCTGNSNGYLLCNSNAYFYGYNVGGTIEIEIAATTTKKKGFWRKQFPAVEKVHVRTFLLTFVIFFLKLLVKASRGNLLHGLWWLFVIALEKNFCA